jgi:polyisoprenoid-binding protein YceI
MAIVGALVLGVLVAARSPAPARAAETWTVDPVHATVLYRIRHLGLANSYGRFNNPAGTLVIDSDDPSKCSLEFVVQTDKIDSGVEKRDTHLKSPVFFDAKKFPTISFKSTAVSKAGDDKFEVKGDLTLHGVTRPISFVLEKIGEGAGMKPGEVRSGWETTLDLKRSDYGVNGLQGPVGDDVHLIFSFEAIKG